MPPNRNRKDGKITLAKFKKKNLIFSPEVTAMNQKLSLMKLDREVAMQEYESVLKAKKEERTALRIGNSCLTHMRFHELQLPIQLNAKVFEDRDDKLRMEKVSLTDSIPLNSSTLFKYGKRLLKEDCISKQKQSTLMERKFKLEEARQEAARSKEDYEQMCEEYLHKEAMVEHNKLRELSAKGLHQKFSLILEELNKDVLSAPNRIAKKEKQIKEVNAELVEFSALRERARKMAMDEEEAAKPLKMEMDGVTEHFSSLIQDARNELEYRRKGGSLAKFLAARDYNNVSNSEESDIVQVGMKRRGKFDSVVTLINQLKDAFMVSDIDNVVACFYDQLDVIAQMKKEKAALQKVNEQLRKRFNIASKSNNFLNYDATHILKIRNAYNDAVRMELILSSDLQKPEILLSTQDKLMSSIIVALNAIRQKLRPIQQEEDIEEMQGAIPHDMEMVMLKTERMLKIIKENTVPIGPIRPNMLNLFKEERVPEDSIRVSDDHLHRGSTASFRSYHMDAPNLIDRETLKKSSEFIVREHKEKKKQQLQSAGHSRNK